MSNITVKFEDNVVVKNITLSAIKRGTVKHPNCPKGLTKDDINMVKTNKYGWEIKIHEWRNKNDIDVLFLYDGSIAKNKQYQGFKEGVTEHPIYHSLPFEKYIFIMNEVVRFKNNHTAKIKEYRTLNDIDIIFDDGNIVKTTYNAFHNGTTLHPIEGNSKYEIHDRIAHRIYESYIAGAQKRNIVFELSDEDVKKLIFQPCVYCGSNGYNDFSKHKHLGLLYNGIDRIDSSKGYTIDNVVSCCKKCNITKSSLPYNDWIVYLDRLSNHYINNKNIILDKIEKYMMEN